MTNQSEIIAQSMVPEGAPTPAGINPEQQLAIDAGRDLSKRLEITRETDHPIDALLVPKETKNLSDINITAETERRFSDPTIKAEAEIVIAKFQKLAELGLDGFKDASGNPTAEYDQLVSDYVKNVLDIRSGLDVLTPDQKKAIAEDHLKNSELRAKIAKALAEKLSPTETIKTEDDEEIETNEKLKADAKKRKKEIKKDIKKTTKELSDLEKTRNEHQDIDPITGMEGVRHQRISELSTFISRTSSSDIQTAKNHMISTSGQAGYDQIKNHVLNLMKLGHSTFADPNEQNMFLIIQYESAFKELNALVAEKDGIDDAIKDKQKDLKKQNKEKAKTKNKIKEINGDLEDLKDNIEDQEETRKDSLEKILEITGNEFTDSTIIARHQELKKQQEEKAKEISDTDRKKLLKETDGLWEGIESKNGHARIVFKEKELNQDWISVLTSGGDISTMLSSLLKRGLAPDPRDTPEEATRKQNEITRIDEKIKNDPDFVKAASHDFVENLISTRIRSGKVPFEGELAILKRYGWDGLLENAINNNNDIKKSIESATAATGGNNLTERLKREHGSNWLAILAMLIAGTTIAPGFVAANLMKKEMGR